MLRTTIARYCPSTQKTGMAGVAAKGASIMDKGVAPQAAGKPSMSGIMINGRATVKGTISNVARSVDFEEWRHVCPDPVGWHVSKIGMATCKMEFDLEEGGDAVQLAALKGMNYIEIPTWHSTGAKQAAKSLNEIIELFDIKREGMIIALRTGIMQEQPDADENSAIEAQNTEAMKKRIDISLQRVRNSSFPSMLLQSGMRYSSMTPEQLKAINVRRVNDTTVAATSPAWIEGALTQISQHIQLETIDLLWLEGLHTVFDGRPEKEIEDEVAATFMKLEEYVASGMLQYYGIYSQFLVPEERRIFPPLPPDAQVPDVYKKPRLPRHIMPLDFLLKVARKVSPNGKHHLRFSSVPFNLTEHTAYSAACPYSPRRGENFISFARKEGLTVMGHRPLESTDLQNFIQRYHGFPLCHNLVEDRKRLHVTLEGVVKMEMDAKPFLEKIAETNPKMPLEMLLMGTVFLLTQRQITNVYKFDSALKYKMMPAFRRLVRYVRQGSVKELKDWTTNFERQVEEMWQARRVLLQHRHGLKSMYIEEALNKHVPRLKRCLILSQKALAFSTSAVDVTVSGLHQTRYVHEATAINPCRGGNFVLTPEELDALVKNEDDVGYGSYNPPHPYVLENMLGVDGKISGQKRRGANATVAIDPYNPAYPDEYYPGQDLPQQPWAMQSAASRDAAPTVTTPKPKPKPEDEGPNNEADDRQSSADDDE
eukprot:PhM_4_TR598/c0_g1_i1/m.84325